MIMMIYGDNNDINDNEGGKDFVDTSDDDNDNKYYDNNCENDFNDCVGDVRDNGDTDCNDDDCNDGVGDFSVNDGDN